MTPPERTEEEQLQRALDLAYAYINRRDRTVAEMLTQLERKGVSEHLRRAAVEALAAQGFLNDERFARLFVSDKRELEQWGSERIRRGLLARGIDRELAEAALAETTDARAGVNARGGVNADAGSDSGEGPGVGGRGGETETELDRALALLRRRFPQPPEDRRDRERALSVLLRKGYESELALDALAAHARGE